MAEKFSFPEDVNKSLRRRLRGFSLVAAGGGDESTLAFSRPGFLRLVRLTVGMARLSRRNVGGGGSGAFEYSEIVMSSVTMSSVSESDASVSDITRGDPTKGASRLEVKQIGCEGVP